MTLLKQSLPSVDFYKTHGIRISQLSHITRNYFSIPENLRNLFEAYFTRKFYATIITNCLREGKITYGNKRWDVIFHRTTLGEIKLAILNDSNTKVFISFRIPLKESGLQPTMLVTLVQEKRIFSTLPFPDIL